MTTAENTTGGNFLVFITMHSDPAMSFFDWERSLEELRGVLADHIYAADWGVTQVYGPDAQQFSTPAICVKASMTPDRLRLMLNELESPAFKVWLSRVDVYVATLCTPSLLPGFGELDAVLEFHGAANGCLPGCAMPLPGSAVSTHVNGCPAFFALKEPAAA